MKRKRPPYLDPAVGTASAGMNNLRNCRRKLQIVYLRVSSNTFVTNRKKFECLELDISFRLQSQRRRIWWFYFWLDVTLFPRIFWIGSFSAVVQRRHSARHNSTDQTGDCLTRRWSKWTELQDEELQRFTPTNWQTHARATFRSKFTSVYSTISESL